MRLAKTQISLDVHPVWSGSAVYALRVAKDPRFLHEDSKDWSDWAGAQADLSIRWFCWFCHAVALFFLFVQIYPYLYVYSRYKVVYTEIIRIHHECPCRIGKCHQRGQIFRGEALPIPWPVVWICPSYMNWLMMDRFSSLFPGIL